MVSPKAPSRFVARDEESVQRRASKEYEKRVGRVGETKHCRKCGIPLVMDAEWRLGIHVWCVYNESNRVNLAKIPSPRYGRQS